MYKNSAINLMATQKVFAIVQKCLSTQAKELFTNQSNLLGSNNFHAPSFERH